VADELEPFKRYGVGERFSMSSFSDYAWDVIEKENGHYYLAEEVDKRIADLQAKLEEKERASSNWEDRFNDRGDDLGRANGDIRKLAAELQRLRAENARLKQPVTAAEWSSHCPRSVGGHVLPGNGIEIANALLASRSKEPEGEQR
jgi:uncharacterized small protein (DUF1192 family)